MDTLGIEPRAFRMRSGCDTTTPCALDTCEHNEHMSFVRVNCQQFTHAHQPAFLTNWNGQKNDGRMFAMWPKLSHPKQITLCGTRTHNLRIRSPTPCPLGQEGTEAARGVIFCFVMVASRPDPHPNFHCDRSAMQILIACMFADSKQ